MKEEILTEIRRLGGNTDHVKDDFLKIAENYIENEKADK